MKDMRFSIDIIWLDEAKKINMIKSNIEPATYPESFCSADTKYVIELNQGTAARLGFSPGLKLAF
jgi:uncharacterized membrane protein (UPF0127 family)